ncbi:hypothetical protein GOV08_04920 [Candidatus Woesearchaeota archaeon]|nr:hypothetical protein [Candidatus Woesearchaeota archaeon]
MKSVSTILPSKHDRYVNQLYRQIKDNYDTIDMNVTFSKKKRKIAEIDIIGKKGDIIDIYEVKCSHRISKARKQLKRVKRLINANRINFFFFCGNSKKLEEVIV